MTIGELIKSQRDSLGLTLEDVARVVGVSKATVSRWESGEIHKMKRDKISALSSVLHLDPVLFIIPSQVITPEEEQLLSAFRAADDRARADALATLLQHPAAKK